MKVTALFFFFLKNRNHLVIRRSVIAEIVAGNHGIGNVMLIASSNFNVPPVFAALLVVGAMGSGMYIFALLETRFTNGLFANSEYSTEMPGEVA